MLSFGTQAKQPMNTSRHYTPLFYMPSDDNMRPPLLPLAPASSMQFPCSYLPQPILPARPSFRHGRTRRFSALSLIRAMTLRLARRLSSALRFHNISMTLIMRIVIFALDDIFTICSSRLDIFSRCLKVLFSITIIDAYRDARFLDSFHTAMASSSSPIRKMLTRCDIRHMI